MTAIRSSVLAACLLTCGCGQAPPAGDSVADGVLALPGILREVSAIAVVDERTLACVQDEAGAVFTVDLAGQRPPGVQVFGPPGDYEGLARVDADWWVLRADGALLHVVTDGGRLRIAAEHALPKDYEDWEGLCHDAARRRLLLLPKDVAGRGKAARDVRCVFAFDLAAGRLLPEPVASWSVARLAEAAGRMGIGLPTKTAKKGEERTVLRLLPSELCTLPGTDDLLVLSAADRVLLRIDARGDLVAGVVLPAAELAQPEGLAVLPDGRLLVASEGGGGPGVVRVVPVPGASRTGDGAPR